MGTIILGEEVKNQRYDSCGYKLVSFKLPNGKWKTVGVHRIVATAFCENPNNYPEVNHLDYNRENNVATNLEWVTHHQNVIYSREHYRHFGETNGNYGNRKLSQFYKDNPDIAIKKQSRKGLQNGRCRAIKVFYKGEYVACFDYISLCCKWFIDNGITNATNIESIRGRINSCVRKNKPYKKFYTFEKI